MKEKLLKEIIEKKKSKTEFAIVTNLDTADSCIYEKNKSIDNNFKKYDKEIKYYFDKKKIGIIENTNLFIYIYVRPIKVIIIGAVHIAQYLIELSKNFNFEIVVIDPRGYFASRQRFPDIKIINKWPKEALESIKPNNHTALIALTHDPKIDDPAIQYAINNDFFYIGALGSKKTHTNRCSRLKDSGFTDQQIKKIFGPIGIKLGGKSAPEIALSIIAQLVLHIYKK